jgi:hypothetical protein
MKAFPDVFNAAVLGLFYKSLRSFPRHVQLIWHACTESRNQLCNELCLY